MEINKIPTTKQEGYKFIITEDKKEIASSFLYLLYNDHHERPFGLIEYVIVDEANRGEGLGTKVVEAMIGQAKKDNCYKLICTSRLTKPKVHAWYEKLGFNDWGKEFRMDF